MQSLEIAKIQLSVERDTKASEFLAEKSDLMENCAEKIVHMIGTHFGNKYYPYDQTDNEIRTLNNLLQKFKTSKVPEKKIRSLEQQLSQAYLSYERALLFATA